MLLTIFSTQRALRPSLAKPTADSRGDDHHYHHDAEDRCERECDDLRKSVVHEKKYLTRSAAPFDAGLYGTPTSIGPGKVDAPMLGRGGAGRRIDT